MADRGRIREDIRTSMCNYWRAITTWQLVVGVAGGAVALAAGRQALRGNGWDEVWFSPLAVVAAVVAWAALRRAAPLVDQLSFMAGTVVPIGGLVLYAAPIWVWLVTAPIATFAASALHRAWSRKPRPLWPR